MRTTATPHQVIKAFNLLHSFPWMREGYRDKYAWLREMYGPLSETDLVDRFADQFSEEGLL